MDRGRERSSYGKGGKGGKGDRSGSRGPPQRSGSRGPEDRRRSSSYDDRRRFDGGMRDHNRDFGGKGRDRNDFDTPSRSFGKKGGSKGGGKKGGKKGHKGSKGGGKGFDRQGWIRRQIEFYLSSENLNVDGKTLAEFDGAWISLDYILNGPKLASKDVTEEEAIRALGHSRTVEYKDGRNGYLLTVVDAPTSKDTRCMRSTLKNWQRTIRNDPHAMEQGLIGKWTSGDVRRMKRELEAGDDYNDRRRDNGRDNDRYQRHSNGYSDDYGGGRHHGGRYKSNRGRYGGYETD